MDTLPPEDDCEDPCSVDCPPYPPPEKFPKPNCGTCMSPKIGNVNNANSLHVSFKLGPDNCKPSRRKTRNGWLSTDCISSVFTSCSVSYMRLLKCWGNKPLTDKFAYLSNSCSRCTFYWIVGTRSSKSRHRKSRASGGKRKASNRKGTKTEPDPEFGPTCEGLSCGPETC